jgi:hypothetical protein
MGGAKPNRDHITNPNLVLAAHDSRMAMAGSTAPPAYQVITP